MAKFRISEYPSANVESPDAVPYPAIVVQPEIDFTDAMVHTSQPFSGDTRAIRISTDTDVCYLLGPSPTATLNNDLLPGGKFEYRWVRPGDSVSIIAAGTNSGGGGGGGGGSLTITDGTNTVTGVTMITGDNLTVIGTTPNAVLQVGGPTNTITGYQAAVLGGFNTASNQYSTAFGVSNTSSGVGSIAFGTSNSATGTGSVAYGNNNTSSGNGSVAYGVTNSATAQSSIVYGQYGTDRGFPGANIFGCSQFGVAPGDNQLGIYPLLGVTSDATPSVMTTDIGPPSTNNQVVLPNNGIYECSVTINGKPYPGGTDYFSTEIDVIIGRGVGAGTTAIVTTIPPTPVVVDQHHTAGAATWSAAVSADTVNGALAITVTGQAGVLIFWQAVVRTQEIIT